VRLLVFVLVLANAMAYAWNAGYFGLPADPDAARVAQQVDPARVRIVGHGGTPPARSRAAEPPAPPAEFCLTWEKIAPAEADRLASMLAEKFPGVRAERRAVPGSGGDWWVHVPPLAGKAEADKRAGELKQAGVADYFVVQDGPNRFAISLGVFSQEKGGQERMAELKAKGIRGARLVQRPGRDPLASVEAHGPSEQREGLLAAIGEVLAKPAAQACQ
jgi:hypothetical protein